MYFSCYKYTASSEGSAREGNKQPIWGIIGFFNILQSGYLWKMCSLCSTSVKSVLRQVSELHVLHRGLHWGHAFGFGAGVGCMFGGFCCGFVGWLFVFFLNIFLWNGVESGVGCSLFLPWRQGSQQTPCYLSALRRSAKNGVNSQSQDEHVRITLWLGEETERLYCKIITYRQKEKASIPTYQFTQPARIFSLSNIFFWLPSYSNLIKKKKKDLARSSHL